MNDASNESSYYIRLTKQAHFDIWLRKNTEIEVYRNLSSSFYAIQLVRAKTTTVLS